MLVVDPHSPTPPYEQVRLQVVELIRAGELPRGSRLPTVRRLAGDLGLAVNTVARSYRELERAGIVETRGRHGTFVAATGDGTARAAWAEAEAYATRVRQLGVSPAEALRLASEALGRLADETDPSGSASVPG